MARKDPTFRERRTLALLNQQAFDWSKQFDRKPDLHAVFTLAADGRLTFNGHILGVFVSEIQDETIYIDAEWFGFTTQAGSHFDFKVSWPYGPELQPFIEYVRRSFPV